MAVARRRHCRLLLQLPLHRSIHHPGGGREEETGAAVPPLRLRRHRRRGVGGDGRDADGSLLLRRRCRGGDAQAEAEPEPETAVAVLLPIPRINRHLHRCLLGTWVPFPGKPGGACSLCRERDGGWINRRRCGVWQ